MTDIPIPALVNDGSDPLLSFRAPNSLYSYSMGGVSSPLRASSLINRESRTLFALGGKNYKQNEQFSASIRTATLRTHRCPPSPSASSTATPAAPAASARVPGVNRSSGQRHREIWKESQI